MGEHNVKRIKQPLKKGVAKVPVVMQMESLECGAASLTMILEYYEKWIPLEQVREDCGVSRDGAKAGNIARAARTYGLDAKGFRYELEQLKTQGTFPCIVHWNFNHFIVLKGFKGKKYYINDPARGEMVISEEEFDEGFTGICIVFSPSETFVPSGRKKSMLSFVKKKMQGMHLMVAFLAITVSITSVSALLKTGFSRFFIDNLLEGQNPGLVMPFLLILTGLAVIEFIAAWIQAVYSFRIRGKLAASENAVYFWHVLHLPMHFFSQRMAADIDQRRSASAAIADILVNIMAPLAVNSVILIFYLVVMIRYSPMMTLIGVASVILNVFLARKISERRNNVTRVMLRDAGKLYAATVSGIEMIETIKASGSENGYFRKWAGYQASVNTQKVNFAVLDEYIGKLPQIVVELVNDIILILGVYLVMKGQFSSGMVMAFSGILAQFFIPAQTLVESGQQIQEIRTQMERIDDVMEYPQDPVFDNQDVKEEASQDMGKLTGQMTMKNISFGYSKLSPPLISGFDLELKPGKSVAFVGGSGSGKSTLSKLISGLYKPWEGEILFDGKPLAQIDRDVFTGSLAVVNQDITIFEDTIANNIRMWDTSIEDFEVILAARDAQIHEDIMNRKDGYQHMLSEGGLDFSGGQRQRMEIARVLAQDPTIIIMDEATSALDAQTEYGVVQAIRDRGITCIVVAHRLSTIRDCDEIIVLDHGNVVERGTHDELMSHDGLYSKLVTSE